MPCKECGSLFTVSVPKPGGRVYHHFVRGQHETTGVWCREMTDTELCNYHTRKAQGWFNKDDEYFRRQPGPRPHEYVRYESYWNKEGHYLSAPAPMEGSKS